MTMVELVHAVSKLVEEGVVDWYHMDVDERPKKAVTIYEQYVPIARLDDPDGKYHPLILVALLSTEDDEMAVCELGLTFAVYGESMDTWIDLLNLMECVRLRLLATQLICEQFQLLKPLEGAVQENQPAPFFYGAMSARYCRYEPENERSIAR